jgi:uncharacterized phage infection (PIP) family protein YhgE
MNTKNLNSILTVLAAAVIFSGCATSGYKQADKTGQGIAEFRDEVLNVKKAVDESMTALNQTAEAAATDPRKAFDTFSKSVDKVESARNKAAKRAADVKAAGAEYFKQWEAQLATISNPDTRALAQKRKDKLNETFSKVGPLLEEAKKDFDPFLANLKDLRTLLSQDLTVAGVDAAKSPIKKSRASGVKVQESLDDLIAEMNSISATLTAAKVPAPGEAK